MFLIVCMYMFAYVWVSYEDQCLQRPDVSNPSKAGVTVTVNSLVWVLGSKLRLSVRAGHAVSTEPSLQLQGTGSVLFYLRQALDL